MFNAGFNALLPDELAKIDLYPAELKAEIDAANEWIYDTVNNGVCESATVDYCKGAMVDFDSSTDKSGFASKAAAYETAVTALFKSLDRLETMLEGKDYLIGGKLTEADVRLYTTIVRPSVLSRFSPSSFPRLCRLFPPDSVLTSRPKYQVRFDCVYHQHFKCNIGSIRHNYPQLNRWLKNLYHKNSAFSSTTNFEHIKHHYCTSHPQINPPRIVPAGPVPHIEPL